MTHPRTHRCVASLAVPTLLKYLDAMATSIPSKEEIIRVVAQFAAEQPNVMAAYLFGSVAQNRMAAESDVDVGVLFETPPDGIRLLELQEELTSVLKCQSDLVNLNRTSPILACRC